MFIKLTTANEKEIYLNTDHIEAFGTITEKSYVCSEDFIGYTYIVVNGMSASDEPYIVKEFPSEIAGMIKEERR